ncbi:hypothetical protein B0H17DRAFT_1073245 [Mycena rosella]|uniref:Uncharacterized protein n=1 Tax=Mycena rosella TaxID=1033263 RepID=A0AAD7D8R8_MYCRO|nr:hypothetical protein B0H17DRAFT_1073245 [Mycena rosella]
MPPLSGTGWDDSATLEDGSAVVADSETLDFFFFFTGSVVSVGEISAVAISWIPTSAWCFLFFFFRSLVAATSVTSTAEISTGSVASMLPLASFCFSFFLFFSTEANWTSESPVKIEGFTLPPDSSPCFFCLFFCALASPTSSSPS